jgi:GTP-binding protein Era
MEKFGFKSGFVALAGRTNVGKSTLINNIIGSKIVITSSKAQTTRNRVNCVYNEEKTQIIFVDIPGFLKPKTLLTEKLNRLIVDTLKDADVIVVLVDIAAGIGSGDLFVFDKVKGENKPLILVLNKIDLVSKEKIELEMEKIKDLNYFDSIVEISALKGINIDKLINEIKKYLPEGPVYYPNDIISDRPIRNIVEDIIREKLINKLSEEIPHSIAVEIERFEEGKDKNGNSITRIAALIYVQKKSHKKIVIGKSGRILKEVGIEARKEIEELLGNKVFLELWIKVKENWTMDENVLKELGYSN